MMLELALGLMGGAVALFVPGYLVAELLFRQESFAARILVGACTSILISILVGVGLGYNERVASIMGGLTTLNLWIYQLGLIALLGTALAFYRLGIEWRVPRPSLRLPDLEKRKEEKETEDFLTFKRPDDTPEFILHRDLEPRR